MDKETWTKTYGELLLGDEEVAGIVKNQKEAVEFIAEAGTDNLSPTLLVAYRDYDDMGEVKRALYALAVPFNEHEEKHLIMTQLGLMAYQAKQIPLAVCLTTEAWMSEQRVDGPRMQPRDDPARREAAVIACMTLDRKCFMSTNVYTRGVGNRIVLSEWDDLDGAAFPIVDSFWRGYTKSALERMN